jgi:hypothetical protein
MVKGVNMQVIKKYKVLPCDGYNGLTINSKVKKPGEIFSNTEWSFGEESLKKAVEKKRCKLIEEKDSKKDSKKDK